MDNFCNPHNNKQNKTYLFVLSNLHIRGFRTGTCKFDKFKYELLECHIKQLFIGYCIRGFLTCCIGLSLYMLFTPCLK